MSALPMKNNPMYNFPVQDREDFGTIREYDYQRDSQIWGRKYLLRNMLIVGVTFYLMGYLSGSAIWK